jgi:hypothetical protein
LQLVGVYNVKEPVTEVSQEIAVRRGILANPEPSTHGHLADIKPAPVDVRYGGEADILETFSRA